MEGEEKDPCGDGGTQSALSTMKLLKVKRGRAKVQINLLKHDVDELCKHPKNIPEVKTQMIKFDDLVKCFQEASTEYYACMEDDDDRDEAETYRQAVMMEAYNFKYTVGQWIAEIEENDERPTEYNMNVDHPPLLSTPLDEGTSTQGGKNRRFRPELSESTLTEVLSRILEDSRIHQQSLVDSLQLPKSELPMFNGDPLKYWPFIRAFRSAVDCKATDDASKLLCLNQYCTGKAKDLLQCCLVKEPSEGYKLALSLLENRFGNSLTIAQEWINKIMNKSEIKGSNELQDFSDELKCCHETLKSMGYSSDLDNSHSMLTIIEKLPHYLRTRWLHENFKIKSKYGRNSRLKDVVEFISQAAEEASDPVFGKAVFKVKPKTKPKNEDQGTKSKRSGSFAIQNNTVSKSREPCPHCQQDHYITQCPSFKALRVKDRIAFVRSKQLCMNCFKPGHLARECLRQFTCTIDNCGQKHSRFLHIPRAATQEQSSSTGAVNTVPASQPSQQQTLQLNPLASAYVSVRGGKIAMPIFPARVRGVDTDDYVDTYALLDPGTNGTYCTKQLQRTLGLSGEMRHSQLTTINQENVPIDSTVIALRIADINDATNPILVPEVTVRPSINISMSGMARKVEVERWPHLRNLPIDDINAEEVHLLIGQDCSDFLIPQEVRRGKPGEPFAIRTALGWAINGPIDVMGNPRQDVFFIQKREDLEKDLEKLWAVEDDKSEEVSMSRDDQRVLEIWKHSSFFDGDNYTFDIPFKNQPPSLPNNLILVKHRLNLLGKRLLKNPTLKEKYTDEIHKLITKGHAEVVPQEELVREDIAIWYLPHHAVHNPKKPEKCRIVYDCAAMYQGTSLNKNVYQGPDLNNKLVGVLLRFRQCPVAFMADIEGMFLQVKVTSRDRNVLRFLWWKDDDPSKEIITFRMTRHLFGGNWSPSCATYALQQTARDHEDEYPSEVISTVMKNFYVDDCLKSVKTTEQAMMLAMQVKELLAKGGFHLTKFISNSRELLDTVTPEERAKCVKSLDLQFDDLPCERALGVTWDTEEDCFTFDVTDSPRPRTKRGVLSTLSALYDPLGFVSPFILKARQIFQELCRLKITWDEPLPSDIDDQWGRWLNDLPKIRDMKISRCVESTTLEGTVGQLHHFSDASEVGYGAVSYLLQTGDEGQTHSTILMAKSRLAPLKTTTIPRLELAGALEAVRLDILLRKELEIPLQESVFWTDSNIVIWYIQNDHQRFQIYVANRVAKICDQTKAHQWRHVPTDLNPGDDASRGLTAEKLVNNTRWKQGPAFLREEKEMWPVQQTLRCLELEDQVELKANPQIYALKQETDDPIDRLFSKYSSWYRLKRAVAWILKWKQLLLKRNLDSKELTVNDIQEAEVTILQNVQSKYYPNGTDSKELLKLTPQLDSNGILQVGGRLVNAEVPKEVKHPIILPCSHHISQLIVKNYHDLTGHTGVERTLAETRLKFWIIKGRTVVRQVLSKCITCRRLRAPTETQLMADLPASRVSPNEPAFYRVGVDYFGPFTIKQGRSNVKRYGCIFTCLTTRAVHIEISHSLDTDSFINALQRFIARRGEPIQIYSDNGTNFVGAHQELKKAVREFNQHKITDFLMAREISWKYNPPSASHMGGAWERQIRTIRSIFDGLLGQQRLDDESLVTLMTVVEGVINNRPITKLSDDPNDATPLTPNHLLLYRSGPDLPPGKFVERDVYRRRWRQVQYLTDVFWTRWTREYMTNLQERQKWCSPKRNFQIGDLVLIKQDNQVRNQWPLGLVTETYPSADGFVRAVAVRTSTGVYDRPIHKLCLLEGATSECN